MSELIKIDEMGIPQELRESLDVSFGQYFREAKELELQAKEIVVTSPEQIEEMKQARDMRLKLKKIRCDAESKRKELKSGLVLEGKAIDGFANIIKYLTTPIEEHLQKQEDFEKLEKERKRREEEERKIELFEKRSAMLEEFIDLGVSTSIYNLSEMTDDDFTRVLKDLNDKREAHNAEVLRKQREQEELDRIRKLEEQRIREENARLKKEAEEAQAERDAEEKKRQAEIEKARKEHEKQLAVERAEREKAEAELAEKKRIEDEAREQKRLAELAPDKDKLHQLIVQIESIELPVVSDPKAKKIRDEVNVLLQKVSRYILTNCQKL